MIEYLIPHSPDERVLKKASLILKKGGLVVFPTDTNWIIACDPFSKIGVEKFYHIKKERNKLKHYSVLCDSLSKASEIANIHNSAFRSIRNKVPGNYTFIFTALKKITKVVSASKTDHEVGIRFVPSAMVTKLIECHGEVLLSTQITPDMIGLSDADEIYSYLIEEYYGGSIEMILDPGEYSFSGPSTIINFTNEAQAEVQRLGVGVWP